MQYQTPLTAGDKSAIRSELARQYGFRKSRGMTDNQLLNKLEEFKQGIQPPKHDDKPQAMPPKDWKPSPKLMGEEDKPKAQDKPKAEAKPKPAPSTGGLESAITDIMKTALEGYQPEQQIDEQAIIDLIEKHSNAPRRVQHDVVITRPDNLPKIEIKNAHPILSDVLDCARVGINVFLSGPAGSGKTSLAAQVADALGYEFFFTGAITDKYELTGFIDANGTYHESPFYKALKAVERGADGAVFLFDEKDASNPNAAVAFNAALANGYMAFPNETVYFDKSKVFFIAAANTLGTGANRQYVGRYPLDGATLDRYKRMIMDYDLGVEMSIAENSWLKAGGDADQVSVAQNWAHEVVQFRKTLNEKKIVVLISPRATERGALLLAAGWAIEKVREELYIDLSDDIRQTLGV